MGLKPGEFRELVSRLLLSRTSSIDISISQLKKSTQLGRLATTDEIAKLVSFLASEQSSYITGTFHVLVDKTFRLTSAM